MKAKAISLWQPYASAMALGWKKNETRPWATKYRGPLFIHAAAKKVIRWPSWEVEFFFVAHGIESPADLPLGALLCKVELIDCVEITIRNRPTGIERYLGNYTPGRFMWITDHLETFEPIPWKGRQRIFNVELREA